MCIALIDQAPRLLINLGMDGKLIELTTGKLLEKFGAGNHKPGSGSAAAFQGMMSAQLLRTVIDLTNEPKRRLNYAEHLTALLKIKEKIEQKIYPALEELFQKDSVHFDAVIKLRERRDKEKNFLKKRDLSMQAQEQLKPATIMPLEIAEYCLELAGIAEYVFDHGFRAARGDSGVALNYAISGVGGCLSIVELNLISLPKDEWMEKTIERKKWIKSQYGHISGKGNEKLAVLEKEAEESRLFHQNIAEFHLGNLADFNRTNAAIEKLVRKLQNTIWTHRNKIWKSNTPENYLQILQPDKVLEKVLGYAYFEQDELGTHEVGGERFEIAGVIDKTQKLVRVSRNFPDESKRFTIAHELGHAILHRQNVLHRDKSIDGSPIGSRSLKEMQADKFATYFLMPANLVRDYFETLFQMPTFIIDNNTAHYLNFRSASELRKLCKSLRGLSRLVASAEYFAGNSFKSLAKIFEVSNATMAIRLEELELIEW